MLVASGDFTLHPIRVLALSLPHSVSSESLGGAGNRKYKDAGWIRTAMAMSGLSDYAMKYAYWRFCSEDTYHRAIRTRLVAVARAKANESGYKMRLETVVGITSAAISQVTQPWCTRCNGKQTRLHNGDLSVCPKCKGTAQVQLTQTDIAAHCNCSRSALKDNHNELYNFLIDTIYMWDRKVIAHIRKNIESELGAET